MEFDPKSFYKYLAYISGGAALGAAGMYTVTDYFLESPEVSKSIEYSLEGLLAAGGAGIGGLIASWFYDSKREVLGWFYAISCALIGLKCGFELGEFIAKSEGWSAETARGVGGLLSVITTPTGAGIGALINRFFKRKENKKNTELIQQP